MIFTAKYQARYVVIATHRKAVPIDLGALLVTEMTITSALGYPTEMPEVLAALPRLGDKLASFITHCYTFDNVLEGFRTAADPLSTRVTIEFDQEAGVSPPRGDAPPLATLVRAGDSQTEATAMCP